MDGVLSQSSTAQVSSLLASDFVYKISHKLSSSDRDGVVKGIFLETCQFCI